MLTFQLQDTKLSLKKKRKKKVIIGESALKRMNMSSSKCVPFFVFREETVEEWLSDI